MSDPRPTLVIHGGAGVITRALLSAEREAAFRASLRRVLLAGRAALAAGAPALDVVTAAVAALEDDALFNAGHGSVFTSAGTHELDAAVMASDGRAGAVAGVRTLRNPVRAARALLDASTLGGSEANGGPVLLAGAGADAWGAAAGLAGGEHGLFSTEWRREQLAAHAARGRGAAPALDHDAAAAAAAAAAAELAADSRKHGTVGAVALDVHGALAAATSTGGLTGKMPGRVGDSPVFGAGTFADSRVAVSCTGTGEAILRVVAAKDCAARIAYGGAALAVAARAAIDALPAAGGDGGLIALGANGAVAMPFNTEGMYRGVARAGDDNVCVAIFGDDESS